MIKYRYLLLITLIFSLVLTIHSYADPNTKPKKITRAGKTTITANTGQKFELNVKINPLKAEDDFLRWTDYKRILLSKIRR